MPPQIHPSLHLFASRTTVRKSRQHPPLPRSTFRPFHQRHLLPRRREAKEEEKKGRRLHRTRVQSRPPPAGASNSLAPGLPVDTTKFSGGNFRIQLGLHDVYTVCLSFVSGIQSTRCSLTLPSCVHHPHVDHDAPQVSSLHLIPPPR
jgi:hypothetical protein